MNPEDNIDNKAYVATLFVCNGRDRCGSNGKSCSHYEPHEFDSCFGPCERWHCRKAGDKVECVEWFQ
jgi:hypothetical protein